MAGVAITSMELSAIELRATVEAAKTPAVVARILALAGARRDESGNRGETCGMDRQLCAPKLRLDRQRALNTSIA